MDEVRLKGVSQITVQDTLLRTTKRLTSLFSVFCVVSWRIFWLTMVHLAALINQKCLLGHTGFS
ncbi:hypothetical protein IHE33_10615 [Mycetohabitans endofungorum]|uniref:hypothetical protein n=1 Tax=Mycetohabitans endofungorum TaxID=417203 RepID=UPI0030D41DBE